MRLLSYVKQPARGQHYNQSGVADWLLRELHLRKHEEREVAPRPVASIVGVDKEKAERVCA